MWLTATDVDLKAGKNGAIYVRTKTVSGEFWEPKNKRNRRVPISRRLRPYLESYLRRPSLGNWYFPSPHATRWDPDNFSEHLRDLNRSKKLDWSCGDYRHTFGSQLAMRGESLYKISELMGNSPEICRKHYAKLTPESLEGASEFPEEEAVDFNGPEPPAGQEGHEKQRRYLRLLDPPTAKQAR